MATTFYNTIEILKVEQRKLEKYLMTESDSFVRACANEEIGEIKDAINILKKH